MHALDAACHAMCVPSLWTRANAHRYTFASTRQFVLGFTRIYSRVLPGSLSFCLLQVMKQLSSNPTADSIAKGWQVMCMCVSTFPPSTEFELYLLNFMHEQKKKKGAVRNYAKY